MKWTEKTWILLKKSCMEIYLAKRSPLNIWRVIILFTFWASGPELHCKYTCYIIACLEKESFWSIWQINTLVSLWSETYLAAAVTHMHSHKRERGGRAARTTIPECSSSYLPSDMDTEAPDGQQSLVHGHSWSLTACVMSAQDAQRVKRLKPSADGGNLSLTV